MTRVLKLICVVAFLLLDVCVVTPWLLPPTPGVDRAFIGALIPLAIAAFSAMKSKKKKGTDDRDAQSGALTELLNFQKQRMMSAEPLNQSGLAMASSMMPSYMKTAGGGVDQWMNNYNQGAVPGMTPRTPVPGRFQLPGAQWEN